MNAVALLRRARARGLVFRVESDSVQVKGGSSLADKSGALAFLREHKAAVLAVLRAETHPLVVAAREVLGAELVSVRPTPSDPVRPAGSPRPKPPADRVLCLDFGKRGRRA